MPILANQMPLDIAKRALAAAKVGGYDVLILDTAGRQHIDEGLMSEVARCATAVKPHETLLVADSLTGQDAVNIAKSFNDRVTLSGIVLTRADGDARGGAALSMRASPARRSNFWASAKSSMRSKHFIPPASRPAFSTWAMWSAWSKRLPRRSTRNRPRNSPNKMKKGEFDMNDLADQLRQMKKLGGMQGVLAMLPGVGKIKDQLATAGFDDGMLKRQEAIILSMTKVERSKPDVINGSRRKRIASGAGVEVSEVNKLLKMHRQMADMMKKMGRMGGKMPFGLGGMPQLPPGLFPGGRR